MTSHITRLQRRGKAGLTVQKAIATARQLVCAHNRLARALCAPGGRITGRGSRGEHLRARQSARGTVGCWRMVTSQTRKVFATLPPKAAPIARKEGHVSIFQSNEHLSTPLSSQVAAPRT